MKNPFFYNISPTTSISSASRRDRPRRMRRPLALSSASAYLHILILISQRLQATHGSSSPWSPIAVGFRSALAYSSRKNEPLRMSPRMSTGSGFPVQKQPLGEEEIDDGRHHQLEYAFALERDKVHLFSAQSAYLHAGGSESGSLAGASPHRDDEFDSLMGPTVGKAVPCSATTSSDPSRDGAPSASVSHRRSTSPSTARGGASTAAASMLEQRPLVFWENMVAGAISRSIAQTIMHPANTMKTMLQTNRDSISMLDLLAPRYLHRLTRGAGANFILSVPHGAVNFAVLEFVRKQLSTAVEASPYLSDRSDRLGPSLDFLSSAISTITCSVVSTPQMVIADNIMAGNYPNLISAIQGLAANRGVSGFYKGWWPGLVGKIPSYALTWTFFQQLKEARDKLTGRPATDFENIIMGCIASGTTVCIMIPLDTIKTRLVTQSAHALSDQAYKGIIDCAVRVAREEGVRALYRGLTPRLISVVPMIGIQFGVYEFMKKTLLDRSDLGMAALPPPGQLRQRPRVPSRLKKPPALALPDDVPSKEEEQSTSPPIYGTSEALQEAAMEVAASPEVPFPAPRFLKRKLRIETQTKLKIWKENGRKRKETNKR